MEVTDSCAAGRGRAGGVGVSVPVSLLVADSLLARKVLRGHEEARRGSSPWPRWRAMGNTLRQYSQILRTGSTVINTCDKQTTTLTFFYWRRTKESVDKLRQLLKMLDSQIILDHGGTVGVEPGHLHPGLGEENVKTIPVKQLSHNCI